MSGPGDAPRSPGARLAVGGCVLVLVTVGGAALGLGLHELALRVSRALTGFDLFSGSGTRSSPRLPGLGDAFVLVAPVAGALVWGPLLRAVRGAPVGVAQAVSSCSSGGARLRAVPAVASGAAVAVGIGTGSPVGLQGQVVAAALGLSSSLVRAARLPPTWSPCLLAACAAAGFSALFATPVAAVALGVEVLLRRVRPVEVAVLATASVTGLALSNLLGGGERLLPLPVVPRLPAGGLVACAVVGVLAFVVARLFVRSVMGASLLMDRLWRGPAWLRPAVGMVPVGLVLLAVPALYGSGLTVINQAAHGELALGVLVVLLAGKLVVTGLSLGAGQVGGTFEPLLFLGAVLGGLVVAVGNVVVPASTPTPVALAVVGMAAVYAAGGRAPVTAVALGLEVTGQWLLAPGLVVGVLCALVLTRAWPWPSVYDEVVMNPTSADTQAQLSAPRGWPLV